MERTLLFVTDFFFFFAFTYLFFSRHEFCTASVGTNLFFSSHEFYTASVGTNLFFSRHDFFVYVLLQIFFLYCSKTNLFLFGSYLLQFFVSFIFKFCIKKQQRLFYVGRNINCCTVKTFLTKFDSNIQFLHYSSHFF